MDYKIVDKRIELLKRVCYVVIVASSYALGAYTVVMVGSI